MRVEGVMLPLVAGMDTLLAPAALRSANHEIHSPELAFS